MERWDGIERGYTDDDVRRLRGSVRVEHTLARLGAERLWNLLQEKDYVAALGAMTGGQAVEMVKAGLDAIYLRGRESRRRGLSRPEPLPGQQRAGSRSPPEQRFATRGSDRVVGGLDERALLARADRR
jgi:isocitrate lyase